MITAKATNDDIMRMLTQFAESVDGRFQSQESTNLKMMQKLNAIDKRLTVIEEAMATKDDIRRIENTLDGYAAKMAAMLHKKPALI